MRSDAIYWPTHLLCLFPHFMLCKARRYVRPPIILGQGYDVVNTLRPPQQPILRIYYYHGDPGSLLKMSGSVNAQRLDFMVFWIHRQDSTSIGCTVTIEPPMLEYPQLLRYHSVPLKDKNYNSMTLTGFGSRPCMCSKVRRSTYFVLCGLLIV